MKKDREYDIRCREILHALIDHAYKHGSVGLEREHNGVGQLMIVSPEINHIHLDLLDKSQGLEDLVEMIGKGLGV